MHIICPHCTTSYAINPATLGAAGRTVRCSRCKETWLARPAPSGLRLMLAPEAELALVDLPPARQVQMLIGAEGGLDPQEVVAAQQVGFTPVRLGPRVLRTETAALAALAAMQALWGDFGGVKDV